MYLMVLTILLSFMRCHNDTFVPMLLSSKKITPHKLRSTYGTQLYTETGDIYLVADVNALERLGAEVGGLHLGGEGLVVGDVVELLLDFLIGFLQSLGLLFIALASRQHRCGDCDYEKESFHRI
mgnify:CR=1 FL=1